MSALGSLASILAYPPHAPFGVIPEMPASRLMASPRASFKRASEQISKIELVPLDEPSVGIVPRLKSLIFDAIEQIRKDGTAILIVEQDATSTFGIADRVYVLEHGRTVKEGRASDLAGDEYIRQVYLGV